MRFDAGFAGVLLIVALGCSSGGDDAAHGADAGDPKRTDGGGGGHQSGHDASSATTTDAASNQHAGGGGTTSMHASSDAGSVVDDASAGGAPYADDTYAPWAGGADYYAKFAHGPRSDYLFFPIAVWLQSPDRAADYAAIGVNTYIGLWQGPTEDQLSMLSDAKMPVACDQNDIGLAHVDDDGIIAWTQQDEPDNAQAAASGNGYDPCIPASEIKSRYDAIKAKDATRPVFLNLGQGVAHDYIGWGNECSVTHPADYPDYLEGADIVSFDIYPSNETAADVAGKLWFVAEGVKNLVGWAQGKMPVWNWIECTGIDDPSRKPTPQQVEAEVWMSIVAGSMGIGYFVHQFNPSFDEHALLDDDNMRSAVQSINQRITGLAPVLNEKSVTNGGSVTTDDADAPVAMMLKRRGGATYIFAVAMRGTATHATFSGLTHVPPGASVEVLDENRFLQITGNSFEDDFEPWGVHVYDINLFGTDVVEP